MTRIVFLLKCGQAQGFIIDGHTGFACEGNDIICAGVSALAVNAVNSIEKLCGIALQVNDRDGYMQVMLPEGITENENKTDKARLLLESAALGFQSLAEQYPKYILFDRAEV